MDAATREAFRQRLLEQQRALVRRIYDLEAELAAASEREIEYGDRAQAEDTELDLELLDEQSRREWEEIQAALARLEAGTYGRCEACGKEIPRARLEVLPTARRCVRCQETQEVSAEA
ncbi:MAG: molecular chaperone DnaK [Candidatus Tectimicrobiota bacterium]|nr:MAG: molecular chaperone DnaK [Candidatus Tectomicrobia bacterium]